MLKSFFFWYSILGTKNSIFFDYRFLVRLCVVNALTFRWWSRLLLGLAILSSCVCSSNGAFLQQPLSGAYKLWRTKQSPGVSWINDCCDDVQVLLSYGETKQTSKGIPPSACFTHRVRLLLIIITLGISGDMRTNISYSTRWYVSAVNLYFKIGLSRWPRAWLMCTDGRQATRAAAETYSVEL